VLAATAVLTDCQQDARDALDVTGEFLDIRYVNLIAD
jgi:hypothetical protein